MSHSIHTTARRMLQDVTNTPTVAPARKKPSVAPRVKDRAAEIEALPSEVRTAVFPPAWRAALDSADDQKREANASRVRTISRRLATFAVIVAVAFAVVGVVETVV